MEHINERIEKLINNISDKQIDYMFEIIKTKDKYADEFKSIDGEYMRLLKQLDYLVDTYNNKEDIIKEIEKLIDERESIRKEIFKLKKEKQDLESDIIFLKNMR